MVARRWVDGVVVLYVVLLWWNLSDFSGRFFPLKDGLKVGFK